jgi:ankyrin repeat protein
MMLACNLGAIPLAKGLVEKGADLSVIDRMGYTALMYASAAPASSDSSVDLVKTILEKGTKQDIGVNAKSKQDGHTALLLAASSNNWDICKALIVRGVTLDNHIMNENELAVIHLAAASGQVDVTQLLIEHGAEVNTYSKVGNKSPLYMAAKSGSVATATALLKAGADPNHRATDRDNFTPLMVATVARDKRMVRALLEGRADPTVKCHQCSSSVATSSPSSSSCVERTARELARTRGVEREWADMASLLNLAETEWRLSHKENERGEREK